MLLLWAFWALVPAWASLSGAAEQAASAKLRQSVPAER
jgi:hypothetical protein